MYIWIEKLPEWLEMTQQELKKVKTGLRREKFHAMEVILHKKFLERRADGWRVSYAWITTNMNLLCKEHLPPGYDPDIHKFGTAWVRRFCKRWNISLRKKSNAKCKSVFERLHQIKNYDKWLIYHWQDTANWDDPYFDYNTFTGKNIGGTNQDCAQGDSSDEEFELSEETESSSEE